MLGDKFELAKEIVREAKLVIETKSNSYEIKEKAPKDLVTEVDFAVEQYISNEITKHYPNDMFLGEESFETYDGLINKKVWIVDPIDGTCNFIHQSRNYAITLAYVENGTTLFGIIYDVVSDIMYTSLSGHGAFINGAQSKVMLRVPLNKTIAAISPKLIFEGKVNQFMDKISQMLNYRYLGVASLEMIYVALGEYHLYIGRNLKPWDFVAAKHFIEMCGGVIKTIENKELDIFSNTSLVVGNTENVKMLFEQ